MSGQPGRKRTKAQSEESDQVDDTYVEKRKRNNEAVNRTRQKKRQEESETAEKVDELRTENEQLERKIDSLQKHLSFLKEMLVEYANGGKKDGTAANESGQLTSSNHSAGQGSSTSKS